jgi:hypothetical protein
MGHVLGKGRGQGSLFPTMLDDLVPGDHVCRVIDAFVEGLATVEHRRPNRLSPRANVELAERVLYELSNELGCKH